MALNKGFALLIVTDALDAVVEGPDDELAFGSGGAAGDEAFEDNDKGRGSPDVKG